MERGRRAPPGPLKPICVEMGRIGGQRDNATTPVDDVLKIEGRPQRPGIDAPVNQTELSGTGQVRFHERTASRVVVPRVSVESDQRHSAFKKWLKANGSATHARITVSNREDPSGPNALAPRPVTALQARHSNARRLGTGQHSAAAVHGGRDLGDRHDALSHRDAVSATTCREQIGKGRRPLNR